MRFISVALAFVLCLTTFSTADARPWRIWIRSPIAVTPATPTPAPAAVAVQSPTLMPQSQLQPQPPMTFQAAPPSGPAPVIVHATQPAMYPHVATYTSVRVKHRHHGRHIHHRSRSVSRSWAVMPAR
jgi:hypothetical protein